MNEFKTDLTLLVVRLAVAGSFIGHGAMKISAGVGSGWMFWLGIVEVVAAILLVLGVTVKKAATVLGIIMLGAIYMKLFTWSAGYLKAGGAELDVMLLVLNFCLVMYGNGKYSVGKKV